TRSAGPQRWNCTLPFQVVAPTTLTVAWSVTWIDPAVVIDVLPVTLGVVFTLAELTVTVSVPVVSGHAVAPTDLVLGKLPPLEAPKVKPPLSVGVNPPAVSHPVGYVPSPKIVLVTGPKATVVQPFGPTAAQVMSPPAAAPAVVGLMTGLPGWLAVP